MQRPLQKTAPIYHECGHAKSKNTLEVDYSSRLEDRTSPTEISIVYLPVDGKQCQIHDLW